MGIIKPEAQRAFFADHSGNAELLKLFLNGFDISFACERHLSNTTVYAYILKPEDFMRESFGFDKEMLLVYSPFSQMEPRSIQAIDELYRVYPFAGRVDTLTCFFMSADSEVESWIKASASNEAMRILIPFSSQEAAANKSDQWYIRNKLRKYFFGLDLFGYTLPLNDDSYFFGRQQIVARYIDSIKRGEDRGIFGLRKTGKTSLLFKLQRVVSEQKLGEMFFYDCKSPMLRKLHSHELLGEIYRDICTRLGFAPAPGTDEIAVVRNLTAAVKKSASKTPRLIIVFDEIEYISFIAPMDEHWKREFVDFWQTIWSIQSSCRNLVFIVSGVNASVSEMDSVVVGGRKIQNPLFGIVQSEYLQGLSNDECASMIKSLGRRMGLKFEYDAVKFLYEQYGGHPMLTRLSCSKLNMYFGEENRPITIDLKLVQQRMPEINSELVYYFRHVISELQEFYPEEYEMFEMLACGQIADFVELSKALELTRHLYHYGLIENDPSGLPRVKLPVAAAFVSDELAKKEGRKAAYKLIAPGERRAWVARRIKSIIQDMRQLEAAIAQSNAPCKLFGDHSFPEGDKLMEVPEVDSEITFVAFVNTFNRCFVESIESYGKSIGKGRYFWEDIAGAYPSLYDVLYRIKVYRHAQDHLQLTPQFQRDYQAFRLEDTSGFHDTREQLFAIEQRLLDALLVGVQMELNNLV